MKYNLFIGRYQSPHKGHQKIFDEYLEKDKPVLIAIRDVKPDSENPLTASEVKSIWDTIYSENNLVKTIIIPDIETVNYGRDVGYIVKEIEVDSKTASISATAIRKQIMNGETDWQEWVDSSAHKLLTQLIKNKKQ